MQGHTRSSLSSYYSNCIVLHAPNCRCDHCTKSRQHSPSVKPHPYPFSSGRTGSTPRPGQMLWPCSGPAIARSSHGKVQPCLCPGSGHIRCTRYCYTKDQLPPMTVTAQDRSRSSVLFHAPRPAPSAAVCTCRTCKCRVSSCSAQGRDTDCRPEKHQGRKHCCMYYDSTVLPC